MKSIISGKEIRSKEKMIYNTFLEKKTPCLVDMFHLSLMHSLRLTDKEYDEFLDYLGEKDKSYIFEDEPTFKIRRELITLRNEFVELKKNEN